MSLARLGDFLFAQTGGQPLYLLETLKLLREREWLVPRPSADGTWRLELDVETAAAVVQEQSRRELLPPSVRAMIQARLAQLTPAARQLVLASAVLGTQATAEHLWQMAEVGGQAGVEALEGAVGSGVLRESNGGRRRHRALPTGARLAPGAAAAAAERAGSLGDRTPLRLPGAGLCLPQRLGEGSRRL